MVAGVELPIDRKASDMEMAETIFGDGVTILSANYTGDRDSSGIYTDGNAISPGVVPGDTGVMFSTGDLRGFTNNNPFQSNESSSTTTSSSGPNGVSDFNAAAGTFTYDASYLDVTFVPTGNVMTMQFVFASEEYPEFASSAFQDFFGVWVNGDLVPLSLGNGDIDPGNINGGTNGNLFQDNVSDQFNTEMDGVTLTLSLTIPVNAGVENDIRIGIADVADSSYDSTVLIAANSVQTALVAQDDSATLFPDGSRVIDVLGNDVNDTGGTLTITHLNGQAVAAGDVVTLSSGQQIQLNADGTVTAIGDGDTEQFTFTYGVESSTGPSDTGLSRSIRCLASSPERASARQRAMCRLRNCSPAIWCSPATKGRSHCVGPAAGQWRRRARSRRSASPQTRSDGMTRRGFRRCTGCWCAMRWPSFCLVRARCWLRRATWSTTERCVASRGARSPMFTLCSTGIR